MTKKIFSIIAVTLLITTVCSANIADEVITVNQLPKKSQEFLTKHFPNIKVSFATKDWDDYKVRLENGVEIEFDRKGEWEEIDNNHKTLPQSIVDLLPKAISNYINIQFPGTAITSVNRDRSGFDVDLSNDLDLEFDSKGNIKEIDD